MTPSEENPKSNSRRWTIEKFKALGIWDEGKPSGDAPDVDLAGGKVVPVPARLSAMLNEVGGGKHNDPSRQDASVITAMLTAGISPKNVFATFLASPRGEHMRERKNGHHVDYLQRTIGSSL